MKGNKRGYGDKNRKRGAILEEVIWNKFLIEWGIS